jgi:hypothetical protein
MECMKKLLNPVTKDELGSDSWNIANYSTQYNGWVTPYLNENILQFQADLVNLVENRVDYDSFDPEYRKQLETYYQFSATRYPTKAPFVAKRIRDTLTLV